MNNWMDAFDSVAIFGSSARNSSDNLSDKDILLVCEDKECVKNELLFLKQNGWSCSVYSIGKIQSLYNNNSLFLQHLKQESIIVKDNANQLKELLYSFSPKNDYTLEINETINNFALLTSICCTNRCLSWSFDVLMVLFRNLAIACHANNGIYEFDFSSLVDGMVKFCQIKEDKLYAIRCLRNKKYSHRSGIKVNNSISEFYNILEIIDDCFNIQMHSKCIGLDKYLEYACDLNNWTASSCWYQNIRTAESILLHIGYFYSDLKDDNDFSELLQLVKKPCDYNILFQSNALGLYDKITRFDYRHLFH